MPKNLDPDYSELDSDALYERYTELNADEDPERARAILKAIKMRRSPRSSKFSQNQKLIVIAAGTYLLIRLGFRLFS